MILTQQEKLEITRLVASTTYQLIKKISNNIIERSWKMRKTKDTADETLKTVSFGEGMEAGVIELINLIEKNGQ